MKNIFLIFLLLLLINCSSAEKVNGFGERDNVCQKYDAQKNITYAYSKFDNPVAILGRWRKIKYKADNYTPYYKICVSNDYNEILYINSGKLHIKGQKNNDTISNFNKYIYIVKNKLEWWKMDTKIVTELIKTDDQSYLIYKISRENKTFLTLIGFKQDILYTIELRSDFVDQQNRVDVLQQCFEMN